LCSLHSIFQDYERYDYGQGKFRAFSIYLCRFEDVHLRGIEKVNVPGTRASQLVAEHRENCKKFRLIKQIYKKKPLILGGT
ncbi:MAG: hypothetical protein ACLFMO_07535, partial [Eubacteriales bacterium]